MTTAYDPATVQPSPAEWVADQARRYEESGGTEGTDMNGYPCLLLDYLGRRSGEWRRTVLIFAEDGGDYLIVASKGGDPEHPAWFFSVRDNPEVHVRVLGERFTARAEIIPAADKGAAWQKVVEVYPPYEDYQKKTDRDIPVIRLRRG